MDLNLTRVSILAHVLDVCTSEALIDMEKQIALAILDPASHIEPQLQPLSLSLFPSSLPETFSSTSGSPCTAHLLLLFPSHLLILHQFFPTQLDHSFKVHNLGCSYPVCPSSSDDATEPCL